MSCFFFFFFFSSRRRHTRCLSDWSSDVCSSDLINNSEGASLGTHQGLHVYGNTHGFVGGYPTTSHTLSCVVLAGIGEEMQRDYWYSSSRDWRDLEQAEAIGRESAR